MNMSQFQEIKWGIVNFYQVTWSMLEWQQVSLRRRVVVLPLHLAEVTRTRYELLSFEIPSTCLHQSDIRGEPITHVIRYLVGVYKYSSENKNK